MDATVIWKNGLSFTGTAGSGFELPLGASPEVGGINDGFRPLELMAVSLAGCTAMDVISILQKKRQQVSRFTVSAHAEQASEHPHVFTHLTLTYVVSGHAVDENALLRAMELSAERYCPAQSMLARVVPIQLHYEIHEDQPTGEGSTLVRQGTFTPNQAG